MYWPVNCLGYPLSLCCENSERYPILCYYYYVHFYVVPQYEITDLTDTYLLYLVTPLDLVLLKVNHPLVIRSNKDQKT